MDQQFETSPEAEHPKTRFAGLRAVRMDRRRFLLWAGAVSAGAALAACAPRHSGEAGLNWRDATPNVVLPSPQPLPPAAGTPEAADGLGAFLAYSALVTGADEPLNPEVGRTYYEALQANPEIEIPLDDLLAQAGFTDGAAPESIEALEEAGLFENQAIDALTQRIINYWFSGVYDTADGQRAVATFVDALAWKLLTVTKPLTVCAFPGAWARPPATAPVTLASPAYLDALAAS